jgi:hypothetical protein
MTYEEFAVMSKYPHLTLSEGRAEQLKSDARVAARNKLKDAAQKKSASPFNTAPEGQKDIK